MSMKRFVQHDVRNMPGPVTVAPEMAIEVLTRGETRRTVEDKIVDFQYIGVEECWLVSIESETVEILTLAKDRISTSAAFDAGQVTASLTFPDLKMPVADIFEP